MNTSSHPLPFELEAGEELLWSVDKQPHLSTHMGLMWGASVLLLVLAGVCAAMDIAGNADAFVFPFQLAAQVCSLIIQKFDGLSTWKTVFQVDKTARQNI